LEKSKFYERLRSAFEKYNIFLFPHLILTSREAIKNTLTNKKYIWNENINSFIKFVLDGTGITIEWEEKDNE
jgi:hypothetical protein